MRSEHQKSVEWCMRAAGQAVRERPEVPSREEIQLRADLILEECLETLRKGLCMMVYQSDTPHGIRAWKPASEDRVDILELADGCADIIVVVLGTLSAFGIDADAVLNEVHRANKAKFPDGKAILREDGKYLKPEGWQPPDIAGVLRAQGWEG